MYSFPSFFCPQAAGIFQFFPVAPVQIVVLGADVGHVETFLHGFPVPAVVAGRAHVSAVHAGAFIVIGSHSLAFGQVRVGQEFVGTAFPLYQFFGCQFPCHPVGYLVFAVVRSDIALAVQYLFGHVFQGAGSRGLPVMAGVAFCVILSLITGSLSCSAWAIGSRQMSARHASTIR